MRVTLRRLNHTRGVCPQYISVEVSLLVASGAAGTREDFQRAGLEGWWLKQVDRFLRRVERKVEKGRKPTPLELGILLGLGKELEEGRGLKAKSLYTNGITT